jgi:hypothetical protein
MVGSGEALGRDDFPGEGAEASLHAVADDGVADLLGYGETDAPLRIVVAPIADEEHKAGCRGTPSGVRGEKIRPFLDDF